MSEAPSGFLSSRALDIVLLMSRRSDGLSLIAGSRSFRSRFVHAALALNQRVQSSVTSFTAEITNEKHPRLVPTKSRSDLH